MLRVLVLTIVLAAPGAALAFSALEVSPPVVPHSVRMSFGPDAGTQMLVAWGIDADVAQWIELEAPGEPARRARADVAPFPAMATRAPHDCTPESGRTPIATKGCTDQPGLGAIAVARLEGLTPGTTYTYRLGTPPAWGKTGTFQTAPREGGFTFTAYGDTPAMSQLPNSFPHTRLHAAETARRAPDFHLHLGDINYVDETYTRHVEWWREWFDEQAPLLERGAYMRALGNHELDVPDGEAYFQAIMPLWEADPVWSFRWGDVAVVSIDSHHEYPHRPQTLAADLDAELAKHADATWRVVTMHAGPYAAAYRDTAGKVSGHGSSCVARADYEEVLARHNVDLVLSGHDHNYQRTHQLGATGAVVDADGDFAKGAGRLYVVAGSGGKVAPSDASTLVGPAKRGACDADISFLARFEARRAHVVGTLEEGALVVRSHDQEGRLLDEVRIR